MKLLNQSLKYLSISILAIVTIWSVVFYVNMLNEIKSSVDEGLENYKRIILQNVQIDSSILGNQYFDNRFFTVHKIEKEQALAFKDQYVDTEIFMQDFDDEEPEMEPVRMLITTFEFKGQYYELKVANSMVEEDDLIQELFWDVMWLYIILITSIVFINNLVLKRLWKPFYSFLSQLKNYRLGGTQEIPETKSKIKEFKDLQQAVNTLLQQNISAFEQQKEFIGNASHELQTPLAIIVNKLELLMETGELKEEQAINIAEVFQIIERLIRLNKSLLLLSKIDNKQFFDNQQVSVNTIVRETIHEFEEITAFKKVTISVSEIEELPILIDATLANIIISNLLKNALFHNFENGKVEISITNTSLKICNTGKNQGLNQEKVFIRFQKSESETSGTGLGLAIVKAVADLYNFPIFYEFKEEMHCFTIQFPKSSFTSI